MSGFSSSPETRDKEKVLQSYDEFLGRTWIPRLAELPREGQSVSSGHPLVSWQRCQDAFAANISAVKFRDSKYELVVKVELDTGEMEEVDAIVLDTEEMEEVEVILSDSGRCGPTDSQTHSSAADFFSRTPSELLSTSERSDISAAVSNAIRKSVVLPELSFARPSKRSKFLPASPSKATPRVGLQTLPEEVIREICLQLPLPSLVCVSLCSKSLRSFLSGPRSTDIWIQGNIYAPPLPSGFAQDGSPLPRQAAKRAQFVFQPDSCVFCNEKTAVPPVSFCLNIRVCLKSDCLAEWRSQSLQSQSGMLGHDLRTDPNMCGRRYRLAASIRANATLHIFVLGQPAVLSCLSLTPEHAQLPWLLSAMGDKSRSELLCIEPNASILSYISSLVPSKLEVPLAFPKILGELDSLEWPSMELRQLVKAGQVFAECSPRRANTDEGVLAMYTCRLYLVSDLHAAVDEWNGAQRDGKVADLRAVWQQREAQLPTRIKRGQLLSEWQEQVEQGLACGRREERDILFALAGHSNVKWADLTSAVSIVKIRRRNALAYYQLQPDEILKCAAAAIAEVNMLSLCRRRRKAEEIVRSQRSVVAAFRSYCSAKASEWGIKVVPPPSIIRAFPTVRTLLHAGETYPPAEWHSLSEFIRIELQLYEEKMREHLQARLDFGCSKRLPGTLQKLDWATSMFRCQTCDFAAEEQACDDHQLAMRRHSKTAQPPVMPLYRAPMTWHTALNHKCEKSFDAEKLQRDQPAALVFSRACKAVLQDPRTTRAEEMVTLGAAWKCGRCEKILAWTDLYEHCLKHVWGDFHMSSKVHNYGAALRNVFPSAVHRSVGTKNVTAKFANILMSKATNPLFVPTTASFPSTAFGLRSGQSSQSVTQSAVSASVSAHRPTGVPAAPQSVVQGMFGPITLPVLHLGATPPVTLSVHGLVSHGTSIALPSHPLMPAISLTGLTSLCAVAPDRTFCLQMFRASQSVRNKARIRCALCPQKTKQRPFDAVLDHLRQKHNISKEKLCDGHLRVVLNPLT